MAKKKNTIVVSQQDLDTIVNSIVPDRDVIQLEEVKPSQIKRLAISVPKKKLPKCPKHHIPMVFNAEKQGWVCSTPKCTMVARSTKPRGKVVKKSDLKLFASNDEGTITYTFKQGEDEIVLPKDTVFKSLQKWEDYEEGGVKLLGTLHIPIFEGQYKDEDE